MQYLNFYRNLLENTEHRAPDLAAQLEEEINILVHKLKFIPEEQRPTVLVIQQDTDFQPIFNEQLVDSIAISGGKLVAEKYDNPTLLFMIQKNDTLYSEMPHILQDPILSRTEAVESNNVYIIQKESFGMDQNSFLDDVEIAAEIVQPKYFIYGHQGVDWVQFDML